MKSLDPEGVTTQKPRRFHADEPAPGVFPDLSKTVEAIHQPRPGKLAYINLLPNYAPAWALGTSNYAEHVARFLQA